MAKLTAEQAAKLVTKLYQRLAQRRPEIFEQERYFQGQQPLTYATPEWKTEHARRFKDFSDNWCGVVGAAPGERTAIDGFRVGDDPAVYSDQEKQLWKAWDANEMPGQASQGFLMSTIAKRSAVLVWGDSDDNPIITWEHPAQCIVDYDPENPRIRRYGLKAWIEDDLEYATLYTPDEVWKYQRQASASTMVTDPSGQRTATGLYIPFGGFEGAAYSGANWLERQNTGDDTWPLTNPLGFEPLIEFQNRPMLGQAPLSDIAGCMKMQDAVNLLWAYLFTAADWAAMPARVVMGQDPPKIPVLDENGQKVGEVPVDKEALTRGRMLWLTGQKTSIGQWEAAKLDVFTNVIAIAVKHIAAQTRTPIHYIVGELGNVNGETLTATETPLAMKVRDSHLFYTPSVREIFRGVALVQNNKALAEQCRSGVVQWRNPETRSGAQLADALLKKKQVGFPFEWLAEEYGLSQTEVARVVAMREKEQSSLLFGQVMAGAQPGQQGAAPDAAGAEGDAGSTLADAGA